jgi:hypothetical protein
MSGMAKRWWQYEPRPRSQELRGVAYTWLAFSATLLLTDLGEWRTRGFVAASSALAVATWHFKRSREAAKIESERRS